jgi:shikimate dehydrogenase
VGFAKALDHWAIPIEGRRILIVGVGGAGVAIAASLAARRAGYVGLYARKPGPAIEVAARLREHFGCEVASVPTPDPAGYDLVINATPLGLEAGDPLAFDVARLDASASVVDILMKNQPTPLLRACESRGIRAYPGFEMLIQQVPEYLSFFGMEGISREIAADLSGVRALFAD